MIIYIENIEREFLDEEGGYGEVKEKKGKEGG